jgi:methionyl-tRNA formyltransferase
MDLIFCGTPQFAVPTLGKLVSAGHQVQLVVTQPDRPRGRGMEVAFSPVKQKALEFGLPITQPDKIKNNQEFRAQLEALAPEAIIVVGYGRIIPGWMLELPKHGNLNLHASLLPKYRGAAPIQWAIAEGETITGVTTMLLNAGLDTGDILLQEELVIKPDDTAVTIASPLAAIGADLMLETLRGLAGGTIMPRPQIECEATLAPILTREDGRIDFRRTATQVFNRQRGFQPWPGAYTSFRGKNLTLSALRPMANPLASALDPGAIAVAGDCLLAGCAEASALEILELQPEGKRRMSAREFINGYRPRAGERLGEPPRLAEAPPVTA